MDVDLPWSPRSRQQEGIRTESRIVKKRGGRVHPRSGAGKIKDDGSTDEEVMEIKDAKRSHTLKASDLEALYKRAAQQGKEARYIVYFSDNDLAAEITLRRGEG
jgi:hypothetical protein